MSHRKSKSQVSDTHSQQLIVPPGTSSGKYRAEILCQYRDAILASHHEFVVTAMEGLRRAISCGEMLADIKALLPHGQWKRWLRENFEANTGLSERTAQRYIKTCSAWKSFLKSRGVEFSGSGSEIGGQHPEYLQEFQSGQAVATPCNRLTKSIETNDWLTPDDVLSAVRTVLRSIDCDPCAAPADWTVSLAEIEYSEAEDGLSADNNWPGTAWIAPGHLGDLTAWCHKAEQQLQTGHLTEAILCLPETMNNLPRAILQYPVAISLAPMEVEYFSDGAIHRKTLTCRAMFVLMSAKPDVECFAAAFRDIAVVFRPATSEPPVK